MTPFKIGLSTGMRTVGSLAAVVTSLVLVGCNGIQDLARQLFELNVTPSELQIRPYSLPALTCAGIAGAPTATVTIRRGAAVNESISLTLDGVPPGVSHIFCENGTAVTRVEGQSNQVHTIQLAFDATAEAETGLAEITLTAELSGFENDNRVEEAQFTLNVIGFAEDGP